MLHESILPDEESFSSPSMPTMRGGDPDTLGRIDHYDLLHKLGGGGFGVVYLARDTVSGVEVAIKTLHPLLKHNAEEMDLLREKFRLVHGLTHPNIAKALVIHLVREINIRDEAARAELKLSPGDFRKSRLKLRFNRSGRPARPSDGKRVARSAAAKRNISPMEK